MADGNEAAAQEVKTAASYRPANSHTLEAVLNDERELRVVRFGAQKHVPEYSGKHVTVILADYKGQLLRGAGVSTRKEDSMRLAEQNLRRYFDDLRVAVSEYYGWGV